MSDKTQTTPLVQPPPPIVADLVRRFGDHIDAYKSGRYNETQLRREFIDPLFRGLGWDVDNEQGYAEAYKDVIHEAAVQIEGAVKAPDYSFRIGGVRKFFLEAKKPSINIKGDPGPAYQLRRYAWSAKLPLSILTDFEEFAVYDCRTRPVKTDSPATARVLYLKYTDYLTRWGEIASIFSREAILTGSFDKYVESKKRKRGTAEVDAAFLQEIEAWRETLARNLALRNAALTQRQLNFAVQVTVDRIIFLRMCEDRGIEDYARLMALLNGDRVYDRLMQLFREADQRYNSGLFHFQREPGRGDPDELTPDLAIDDRVLKDIIKGLYYPDCPYEFSVLPADILGHVYEQFLGKVIRLTPGHRAKVEEKPEVRKAGGVYYTPTYIVQYIVKHTVGKLLGLPSPLGRGAGGEGSGGSARTVKWITREKGNAVNQPRLDKPLRVLDPACGSGSFLLGAYQYLLDWHLDYYTTHDPEKWARKRNPPIYLRSNHLAPGDSPGANYRLTVAERKRILIDHIYGVDIDTQAVEVTKLSLLLKVLEGETTHSLGTHLWYEKERALPDLAFNIKCGNSLIGPDFYDTSGRQMDMFDEEERYRINVFDWHAEFPDVFKATPASRGASSRRTSKRKDPNEPADDSKTTPGFDAIIGNPPYSNYSARDSMRAFYERNNMYPELNTLTKSIEYCSNRYPNVSVGCKDSFKWFVLKGIQLLSKQGRFGMIVPNTWFTHTKYEDLKSILLCQDQGVIFVDLGFGIFPVTVPTSIVICTLSHDLVRLYADLKNTLDKALTLQQEPDFQELDPDGRIPEPELVQKLLREWDESSRLDALVTLREGQHIPRRALKQGHQKAFIPVIDSKNMARYRFDWSLEYSFDPRSKESRGFRTTSGIRVIVRKTGDAIVATLTPDLESYVLQSLYQSVGVHEHIQPEYVLALLNSSLLTFLYQNSAFGQKGRTMAQFRKGHLDLLPVPRIDISSQRDKNRYDRMVALVQQMLDLHKQLAAAKTAHEKTAIERQIDATDHQIDQLVYDLYGLTDDEIKIIEDAADG